MKTILFILQKEFLQIFRNKGILPIIFVMPIIQLIVLVHAATFEIKKTKLIIIDNDLSSYSRSLSSKFINSPFFKVEEYSLSNEMGQQKIANGEADLLIEFPNNFEKKIKTERNVNCQVIINSINGTAAGLINAYTNSIIFSYNNEIKNTLINEINVQYPKNINTNYSYWYNPELNYKSFMVPGILVLLITIIGLMLTAMNIVKEKEIGTIEQINVTPIKKYQFLIGKLLPFWLIALVELSIGLVIGKLLFNIPMVGSLSLLYLVASIYLLVVLGFGIFISTITNTQQQAMFISFFFMMIFILMSGLFTAIENMPIWAQNLNKINPVSYIIQSFRMILLKGSSISDIKENIISLLLYGITVLSLAIFRYRKTSA